MKNFKAITKTIVQMYKSAHTNKTLMLVKYKNIKQIKNIRSQNSQKSI